MIFGEPTDGVAEKVGTVAGLLVSFLVVWVLVLTLRPVFGL